jgi:hypothetical protein
LVGIFYGHLEYVTGIWYILWPFVNLVAIWYIFPRFGQLCQEKSGNPGLDLVYSSESLRRHLTIRQKEEREREEEEEVK